MSYEGELEMNSTVLLGRQVGILSLEGLLEAMMPSHGLQPYRLMSMGGGMRQRHELWCTEGDPSNYYEVVEPSTAIILPLSIIAPVQKAGAAQLVSLHLLTVAKCNPRTALQAPSLGPCDARYLARHAQKFSSILLRRCRLE